jgi:hypothetical protein
VWVRGRDHAQPSDLGAQLTVVLLLGHRVRLLASLKRLKVVAAA